MIVTAFLILIINLSSQSKNFILNRVMSVETQLAKILIVNEYLEILKIISCGIKMGSSIKWASSTYAAKPTPVDFYNWGSYFHLPFLEFYTRLTILTV